MDTYLSTLWLKTWGTGRMWSIFMPLFREVSYNLIFAARFILRITLLKSSLKLVPGVWCLVLRFIACLSVGINAPFRTLMPFSIITTSFVSPLGLVPLADPLAQLALTDGWSHQKTLGHSCRPLSQLPRPRVVPHRLQKVRGAIAQNWNFDANLVAQQPARLNWKACREPTKPKGIMHRCILADASSLYTKYGCLRKTTPF